jgi:DNA-binding transcriptional ArsR family regulator
LHEELSQFIKVLGDASRLAIVHAIGKSSRSITEIIEETDLSQTLVSFHLRVMREKEIVTTRRDGPFINYSLTAPELYDLIGELSRVAGIENGITRATTSLKIVNRNRGEPCGGIMLVGDQCTCQKFRSELFVLLL